MHRRRLHDARDVKERRIRLQRAAEAAREHSILRNEEPLAETLRLQLQSILLVR